MVTIYKGQELNKNNLNIFIGDVDGNPVNPLFISYTIYKRTKSKVPEFTKTYRIDEEPISETIDSTPIPFGIGKFYAPWVMPIDIDLGYYRIKWIIQLNQDAQKIEQVEEFEILERVDPILIAYFNGMSESGNMINLPHEHFKGGDAG